MPTWLKGERECGSNESLISSERNNEREKGISELWEFTETGRKRKTFYGNRNENILILGLSDGAWKVTFTVFCRFQHSATKKHYGFFNRWSVRTCYRSENIQFGLSRIEFWHVKVFWKFWSLATKKQSFFQRISQTKSPYPDVQTELEQMTTQKSNIEPKLRVNNWNMIWSKNTK